MDEFKIPPHSLIIDEEKLLNLIKKTEKFTHTQKLKIIENIPQMKQWQFDDFIKDLEEWELNKSVAYPEEKFSPSFLLKYLNEKVIGQEIAKEKLSLAFYEHNIIEKNDTNYLKPNLVLLGPTGSGKTFMVSELAKALKKPFIIANAAGMVSSGYVGTRLEDVLTRLYISAGRDVKKAENGIMLIDEFDKMVDGSSHDSVGGVELQQEFLKLVEGSVQICKTGLERDTSRIELKTDNILFIFAGAFVKLEDIVKQRLNKKTIGFGINKEISSYEIFKETTHSDIIKFGIIPELVSRIQSIAPLKNLTEEDLYNILKNKNNPYINSLNIYFSFHKNTLEFEDESLKTIAKFAFKKGLGARGLKGVVDKVTHKLKFECVNFSDKNFVITDDIVKEILKNED